MKILHRLIVALIASVFFWLPANAQPSDVPVPMSESEATNGRAQLPPEVVREMVNRLSDDEVRELLLQRLGVEPAAPNAQDAPPDSSPIDFLRKSATGIGDRFVAAVRQLPEIPAGFTQALHKFAEKRDRAGTAHLLLITIGGMVAGLIGFFAVQGAARNVRKRTMATANAGLRSTLKALAIRLAVDLAALAAFVLLARLTHRLLPDSESVFFARQITLHFVAIPLAVAAFTKFLISPWSPEMRLVHTDNWTARFLFWNQIGIALLASLIQFLFGFFDANGLDIGRAHVTYWFGLILVAWLLWVVIRARKGLTQMLIGADGDVTPMEQRMARAYPAAMVISILAIWLLTQLLSIHQAFDALRSGAHYTTLVLIALTPAMDTLVRAIVRHAVPPMTGEGPSAEKAYLATKRSYIRIGRVVLFAIVLYLIARAWDISFTNLAASNMGARFAARFFEVVMILAAGYLVWELATLWFNRKLAAEQTATGYDPDADIGGEGGGAGGSRLSTVLPMLRLSAQVAIIAITVLVALGNVGIDITPLLAGAGIAGIAIGFGAQTLVKDVVSGVFFLVDDAFRVGEYIVIGDIEGTIEKISLRSLQLRHPNGPVHTVPYGEIPKVTNNSRDWVIVKMKFTFPFETDANQIKKIFKQVGKDMLEAPYKDDILQTFKSQGVYDVDDVGIVMRGKFMAKPGTQWIIKKDIYARLQGALEDAGIQFARREVRVQIPDLGEDSELSDDQKEKIAAAAASQSAEPRQTS